MLAARRLVHEFSRLFLLSPAHAALRARSTGLDAAIVHPQLAAGGRVRLLRGKGRKARTVGLDAGGLAVLQRWHDRRRELGLRGGYLLCTLAG